MADDKENNKAQKSERATAGGKEIFARQVRSSTRSRGQHKATLTALGLGRIGKTNKLPDNPAVRGMLRAVIQWLEVKHV